MPVRFNGGGFSTSSPQFLVILLVASLLCFCVYTVEGAGGPLHAVQNACGVVASPFRAMGAGLQSVSQSTMTAVDDVNASAETLSELKAQNEQLRQQVSELEEYRQTAQRLEGIQKLRDIYSIEGVTCHVMSVSGDAWNRVVTIDKGTDDGVAEGLAVVGATGLVGQVKSTTAHSAEVRLLQDPNSGVAVIVQSTRAEGLVKGDIDGLLYLEDVPDDGVSVGDMVITSGLGGGYFRGLMVGTVVRIDDGGQSLRKIVVSPNDTVSALQEVMVVTGIGSEGALDESLSLDNPTPQEGEAQAENTQSADGQEESYENEESDEYSDESSYEDEEYSDEEAEYESEDAGE